MNKHNIETLDTTIAVQKLSLLYKQSRASAAMNVVLAGLLVAILWGQMTPWVLYTWFTCMLLVAVSRVIVSVLFFKRESASRNIQRWQHFYFSTLILIAMIWGFGATIMLFQLSALYQVITYFFLMGMGGGFLVAHSVYRFHILTFMPLLLLPAIAFAFVEGDLVLRLLGLTTFLFMFAGMNATQILTKMLHQNFLLTQEVNEARLEAERMANIDALTGLHNRRAFMTFAEQQINLCERLKKPVTLLLMDVDNFKSINDTYGHEVGDKALIFLAQIMKDNQRESDVIARLGGEEFVVLLANTDMQDSYHYAERLRKEISTKALKLADSSLTLTASIGIAANIYNVDRLIDCADKAMYCAKKQGKNQVINYTEKVSA